MPKTIRNGRYGRTNSAPRHERRGPRRSVAPAMSEVIADELKLLRDDLVTGRLGVVREALAETRQEGQQRLALDEVRYDRVRPRALIRVGHHAPTLPDQVRGRLLRRGRRSGEPLVVIHLVELEVRGGLVRRVVLSGVPPLVRRRGPLHEVDCCVHVLRVLRDDPRTATDLTGRERIPVPAQRQGVRDLAGRDPERRQERRLAPGCVPGRARHHQDLVVRATVLLREARREDRALLERAALEQRIEKLRHLRAVHVIRRDLDRLRTNDLLDRALVGPEIQPVTVRVADGADDVARVLLRNLLADRGPLLPRLRNLVAELVHELLVVVQDFLSQVVLQTDETAVDRALRERRSGPALDQLLREDLVQVGREVERLLAHPNRVVRLLAEDDIRPARAGAVPELDLRLKIRRAVAVTVEDDLLHLPVRGRFVVGVRDRFARGVHPDFDRARRSLGARTTLGRRDARGRGHESDHARQDGWYDQPSTIDLHSFSS